MGKTTSHHLDLLLEVPMVPEGKQAIRNKAGQHFQAPKTREWMAQFKVHVQEKLPKLTLDQPVRVDILAVLPRRASDFKVKDPDGLMWHFTKPDQDNIRKMVLDALKRIWVDDSRVCLGTTIKVRAEKGDLPRTVVRLRTQLPNPERAAVALGLKKPA